MIFDRLIGEIRDSGANLFRISLYEDGAWYDEVFLPTPRMQNVYSVAKSFTAAAVGIAVGQGLLSEHSLLLDFFRDELPPEYDSKLERVEICHLLTHTTGYEKGFLFDADRAGYTDRNYLGIILSRPLEHEPGTVFAYSNSGYYLLSRIIHQVSGLTLEEYLRKYLFGSMDVFEYAWQNCPVGETLGATGLYMSTRDMAKFGVLLLNDGRFGGEQLIPADWIQKSVTRQVGLTGGPNYGYGYWIARNGFFASGANSQVVYVVPSRKIVLAAHAYTEEFNYGGLLDRI